MYKALSVRSLPSLLRSREPLAAASKASPSSHWPETLYAADCHLVESAPEASTSHTLAEATAEGEKLSRTLSLFRAGLSLFFRPSRPLGAGEKKGKRQVSFEALVTFHSRWVADMRV